MHESLRSKLILVDRTLTEQVVRRLRKQIILGQLEPGQRLTELQLAEELDVSRGTVREALRRLEAEYMVESLSHRGSRVAQLAPSDAIEICELHAMLEAHCLKHLALPIAEPLREHLQHVVEQMEVLVFPAGVDRFIDLDHEFHRGIVEAVNQRTVLRVWSDISALLSVLVTLSIRYLKLDAAVIAARHQVILDAISKPGASTREATRVAKEHYHSLARVLNEGGMTLSQGELGEA